MALRLAADFGSRFSAPETARERVREVLRRGFLPAAESWSVWGSMPIAVVAGVA